MAGGRLWTADEDASLLRMAERERIKYAVIAKRLGRTWGSIHSRVTLLRRRRGIPAVPHLHRDGGLQTRVRDLCIPGVPDSAVAGILGVTRVAVMKTRKELDISAGCKQHARVAAPERADISFAAKFLRLYSGVGRSDSEIARILDTSRQRVQDTRRRFGLPALGDPGMPMRDQPRPDPVIRYKSVVYAAATLIFYGKDGCTDQELADGLGIHKNAARNRRARMGLKSLNKPFKKYEKERHGTQVG